MAIDRAKIQKQAETFMGQGRLDRAIDEFLKLIDDKPDDFNLMNRVGDAYLQAGKLPEAIEMFKRAGMGFERGGFNAKASAVFKKAHRTQPDDLDICERLAELYRQTNMIKDAIQIHIEVAESFTKKGLLKRALEEFAKVVDLDPKNLKNKVKLADLYNKEGMREKAAAIYLEVAEALALEQMHVEASQILERAKTMVSTPQVFLTQSRLAVIQKDLPAAAAHLREGLAANPRSAELLDALAEVELQSKAPDRALEALCEVPQLPEKSLALAERALREMVRGGNVVEALKLFKPIGREFGRRGLGEAAAKALRGGLHGAFNAEAWIQLADIAHQSGNRVEQVEHLRRAYAFALSKEDEEVAGQLRAQLNGMGIKDLDETPAVMASTAPPSATYGPGSEAPAEHSDVDVARRMQIQQLERDAEHALKNRFMDRAQETYNRILDLDPANYNAIVRIAEIHRGTGVLSKVQMHYVKQAEKLAELGHKALAVELLDLAEAIFPGSTRLYRRNLGLMEAQPRQAAAPPPIALPAPVEELPVLPMELEPIQELPAISLDLDRSRPGVPMVPEPLQSIEALELPPAPEPFMEGFDIPAWEVLEPPPQAVAATTGAYPSQPEYEWSEITAAGAEELPPLELEPLPFPTDQPAAGPVEVSADLASTLSDIDFQLDYGSPEEAKIEVECALQIYPRHPELLSRLDQAETALQRLGKKPGAGKLSEADFEHSFFDLSDVLGDALLESGEGEEMHDATNVVEKIQSVDELFNAFREGVEQQVKGDDYDTHYNLGIAYKEMLLLDPAIEEFKKAMRDPERTLECCSMLSICEQAQNNPEAAVAWLRQGIEAPGFPPEDAMGLHYDLGLILLEQGRRDEALEEFRIVAGQDPDYRDVARMMQ
ncbi:tetratricopeptide repeat protein [Geothrix sp. 21YS21S-2]|uniref:tetratricopeptide repeat protein n=1 Tax=Geothrix sp. 21YS21S-2 TaxID=3068893 RepID=UPI0027B9E2D7|nr:tetratricopeptide repeat protein [Geothrix sp. 21YS21S-2]